MGKKARPFIKYQSVFFSLLKTVIFLALILIGGLQLFAYLGRNFSHDSEWAKHPNWRKALANYTWYLVQDIGSPPNLEQAKKISEDNGTAISIRGDNLNWSSDPIRFENFPARFSNHVKTGFHHPRLPISIQRHKGDLLVTVKYQAFEYLFLMDPPFPIFNNPALLIMMFALIVLSLALFYWRIKKIFQPLLQLEEGFSELALGHLNFKIDKKGKNEFENLFEGFNLMTEKLSQQWKSQRQFLSDVSHELRSPITRMKLAIELNSKNPLYDSIKEDITEIENITTTLLESERLAHGVLPDKVKIEVHDLFAKIKSKLKDPGISVEWKPINAHFYGSAHLMEIAVSNLIQNAILHSNFKSKITVGCNLEGNAVELFVKDDGDGIAEDHLNNIFDPFYKVSSARTSGKGFGLGLNLVKKIIEAHKGKIDVKSEIGKGTEFLIYLPIENI